MPVGDFQRLSYSLVAEVGVDAPGPTFLTYTPNGRFLLTVGSNNVARKFTVGSDDEPVSIEQNQDAITGVAATVGEWVQCGDESITHC